MTAAANAALPHVACASVRPHAHLSHSRPASRLVDLLSNPGKTFVRDEAEAADDEVTARAAAAAAGGGIAPLALSAPAAPTRPAPLTIAIVDGDAPAPAPAAKAEGDAPAAPAPAGHTAIATAAGVPLSTAGLADAWRASDLFKAQMAAPPSAPPLKLEGDYVTAQYAHGACSG